MDASQQCKMQPGRDRARLRRLGVPSRWGRLKTQGGSKQKAPGQALFQQTPCPEAFLTSTADASEEWKLLEHHLKKSEFLLYSVEYSWERGHVP